MQSPGRTDQYGLGISNSEPKYPTIQIAQYIAAKYALLPDPTLSSGSGRQKTLQESVTKSYDYAHNAPLSDMAPPQSAPYRPSIRQAPKAKAPASSSINQPGASATCRISRS